MNFFGKKFFSTKLSPFIARCFWGSSPLSRHEKSEKIDPGGDHP
jgi:hypothetical protein